RVFRAFVAHVERFLLSGPPDGGSSRIRILRKATSSPLVLQQDVANRTKDTTSHFPLSFATDPAMTGCIIWVFPGQDNWSQAMSEISRRSFVTRVAATGAGLTILPRHVLGRGVTAPSDTLNIAAVGVGGQGRANL